MCANLISASANFEKGQHRILLSFFVLRIIYRQSPRSAVDFLDQDLLSFLFSCSLPNRQKK